MGRGPFGILQSRLCVPCTGPGNTSFLIACSSVGKTDGMSSRWDFQVIPGQLCCFLVATSRHLGFSPLSITQVG